MKLILLFALVSLVTLSCREDHEMRSRQHWNLTSWQAESTTDCFGYLSIDDVLDTGSSLVFYGRQPVTEELLGIQDSAGCRTVLVFDDMSHFSVHKNSNIVLEGFVKVSAEEFQFRTQQYTLPAKIIRQSSDSLILAVDHYSFQGTILNNIKMTFVQLD